MKVYLKGLYSCALRRQKAVQYKNFLTANGHEIVDNPSDADYIIVWTCAFRGDVRDYCLSELKKYEQLYSANVVAGGCLPDIAPEMLKESFHGQVIPWKKDDEMMAELFGNSETSLNGVPSVFVEKNYCDDIEKFKEENPDKDAIFHDKFIKLLISEGCNYKCSYCSERLAFPPFHSFPVEDLKQELAEMVEKTGKYEVVLLADCLGDYGNDIGTDFPTLVKELRTIDNRLRFALNNYNLADFIKNYDEIEKLLREGYFLHLNLPIQSASEKILRLMERPYSKQDMEKVFGLFKEIGFREFDTHIIIGFPGETKQDVEETVDFILKHKPKYVLANSYMEMPAMDSAKLGSKIDSHDIFERMQWATKKIRNSGIICNSDQSDLIQSRFERLSSS